MRRFRFLPVFLLLFLPVSLLALPRFSVQYNQSCHLCHVNPGGGGMRTSYGSQFFAGSDLAVKSLEFEELGQLETRVSERLSIGADFRTMFLHDSAGDADPANNNDGLFDYWPETSGFMQMQGDFYLHFQLAKRYDLVYEQGLSGSYEAYALASILPMDGSFRVGRFLPTFGWRTVDHNAFTRSKLGFSTRSRDQDTGVEFEFHPDGWSASLAVTNGSSALFDDNTQKAITARVARMMRLGESSATLGLSLRSNRISLAGTEMNHRIIAPFASFYFNRIGWQGELAFVQTETLADGVTNDEMIVSQQLSWQWKQGWNFIYSYDFQDPNVDLSDGTEERHRLAMDYIPLPWLSVVPGIDLYTHDNGTTSEQWTQLSFQLHFFM